MSEKKTKVKMVGMSPYDEWGVGDIGYIDGYVRGGGGEPCAVVIIKNKFILATFGSFVLAE